MSTTLKPKPVYKQQVIRKSKTMTEQSSPSSPTLTKVQSHLPDVYLIERDQLWNDVTQRWKIHNYEVNAAMKDLKDVVNRTKDLYNKVKK